MTQPNKVREILNAVRRGGWFDCAEDAGLDDISIYHQRPATGWLDTDEAEQQIEGLIREAHQSGYKKGRTDSEKVIRERVIEARIEEVENMANYTVPGYDYPPTGKVTPYIEVSRVLKRRQELVAELKGEQDERPNS